MLSEELWACFHIWDRTQRGIFPKGTFEAGGGLVAGLLKTPGGTVWWQSASRSGYGFPPPFVAAVDAILKNF